MPETMQTEAPQLPKHKVKYKKAFQRACNEQDAKGKLCGGHLKRWFYWPMCWSRPAAMCGRRSATRRRSIVASTARRCICPAQEEPRGQQCRRSGQAIGFWPDLDGQAWRRKEQRISRRLGDNLKCAGHVRHLFHMGPAWWDAGDEVPTSADFVLVGWKNGVSTQSVCQCL